MTISLVASSDTTCTLNEIDPAGRTSNIFNLPLSRAGIVALLTELLGDPARDAAESGPVRIDRMRDGPRVNVGSASFFIKYADAIPLVLE